MAVRTSLILGLLGTIVLSNLGWTMESAPPRSQTKSVKCARRECADFGPFMSGLQNKIKGNWMPPSSQKDHSVVINFKVYSDGLISDIKLPSTRRSDLITAEHAAYEAIRKSSPLANFPDNAPPRVDIEFIFDFKVGKNRDLHELEASIKNLEGVELARAYRALGNLYANRDETDKSTSAYEKSLELSDSIYGKGSEYSTLTLVDQVEALYSKRKKFDKALRILQKEEAKLPQNRVSSRIILMAARATLVDMQQQHYDAAEQTLEDCVRLSKEQKNQSLYGECMIELCDCLLKRGNKVRAVALLEKEARECLNSDFPTEAIALTELVCDIRSFESHGDEDTVDLARTVYDALRIRYGESSQAALDGLQLCCYCASRGADKPLADAYLREYNVLRCVIQQPHLESLAISSQARADQILAYGECLLTLENTTLASKVFSLGKSRYPSRSEFRERLTSLGVDLQKEDNATSKDSNLSSRVESGKQVLPHRKHNNGPTVQGAAETPEKPTDDCKSRMIELNNNGVRALSEHRFDLAIDCFIQALRLDSSYSLAEGNLAIALSNKALSTKKAEEAIQYMERALFVDPKNVTTAGNLGGIIRILSLDPKSARDRVRLAENALKRNDLAAAHAEYKAALSLVDDPGIRQKLESLPKPDDYACLFFLSATDWEESAVAAHLAAGRECLKTKQFRSAMQEFEFVCAIHSTEQTRKLLDEAKLKLAQEQEASSEKSKEENSRQSVNKEK